MRAQYLSPMSRDVSKLSAMKVVMLAWSVQDYALEFAQAVGTQCAVTLCMPRAWMARIGLVRLPGVDLVPIEWPRHRSLCNMRLLRQLRHILDEQAPDVVHCLNIDAVWLNLLFPTRRAYTWVSTVHDVTYHPGDHSSQKVPPLFRQGFARRSDAIVTHGDLLREQAIEQFGFEAKRVGVIPHVGLFRYRMLAEQQALQRHQDGRLNVLFFGRLYAYKGLRYFLESEPSVRAALPHVRFVVAGQGESFESYRAWLQQEASVDLRNRHIPDEEVAQLFLDADMVVLPYIEASQSGVIPVAVTFGKPVIVTDVGELPALVQQGGMGLVVPARDSRALADAIIRLGRDEPLRRRYGVGASAMAETVLSHESVGKRAVELYVQWRNQKCA